MKTAIIQIGNSDNKLTQNQWAHFAAATHDAISKNVYRIHFRGGSDWDAPWQNACWVCELIEEQGPGLLAELHRVRRSHDQDSVAVTFGETEFV